jgi:hypothetical protein
MTLILGEGSRHRKIRRTSVVFWRRIACPLLLVPILVSSLQASPGMANESKDSDGDGISDDIERATGTDFLEADSDADGVPDGVEDRNRDGRVDASALETDPRRPGLFPGNYPHIPEPLVFDLVRGLGARKGELEANTLVLVRTNDGRVDWAPEVEWAFADGYAMELELPMVDRNLDAIKLALQGTLPSGGWVDFTHGWQTFAEVSLDDGITEVVLLYMFGHRLGQSWSYLTMVGGESTISADGFSNGKALLNASLFVDPTESMTLGLESNTSLSEHGVWLVRVFPQIHLQLSRRIRIQLTAGLDVSSEGPVAVLGTRLIME